MSPTVERASRSPARQRRLARRRRRRRRRGLATLLVTLIASAAAVYLLAGGSPTFTAGAGDSDGPGEVELVAGGDTVTTISVRRAAALAAGSGSLPIEERWTADRGPLRQTVEVDEEKLRERLAEVGPSGAAIEVPERTVASRLDLPIIQQAYPNNCETAALSMLLSSVGVKQDQLVLQREIATAPPLDPQTNADGAQVWGDPDEGFVGRPEGGGPAGGFGVFVNPVMELASRWADPVDLTDVKPEAIYDRLLSGRAVMTWIGLSDGPYSSWLSPAGRRIDVNFGEHTVVLTGIAGDRIYVNDPIDGLKKVWSKDEFESKWALLDRRAVSL